MESVVSTKRSEKKAAVRFFAICMAVLLISSIFIWGFQTNWGYVTIERLTLTGNDGETISTLLYHPKNATNATPAPVVLIMHGRSNMGHSNDTWSMELARRGYVVLSPDLSGGGESSVTDRDQQAVILAKYANTLPYVIPDSLNLVGYSAGTGTCLTVYRTMPDIVNSMCQVFGPFMQKISGGFADVDTNFCLIKSTADQYDWDFLGDPAACLEYTGTEAGLGAIQPNVDYDRNGHVFRYAQIDGTLHQTGNISGATITEIVKYVTDVVPAPVSRSNSDLAWLPQQLFSGVACVTMMFTLAAFINLLMQTEFFGAIANPVPVKEPRKGAKAWVLDILFSTAIPALIFVHVSAYVMKWTGAGTFWSKFLTSNNLNGIMGWLLAMAAIGVIRMIVAANARLIRAIPYILIIFTVMFIGNMNQRVLPSTGNERKDMWISVAVNSVLTASALLVVLLLQYGGSMIIGTGQTIIPQIDIWGTGVNKSCGALDFSFGYCYMMGGTTGVVTYLYRKYGNIWCGVIPCSIFAGTFTLACMTLIA